MRSSRCFPRFPGLCSPLKHWHGSLLAVVLLGLALTPLAAQDGPHRVIQTNGQASVGTIQSVANGNANIKVSAGVIGIPLRNIARVEMPPPAEVDAAQKAYLEGNAAQALQMITPVVQRFQGLPILWSRNAVQLQAEAALATGQIDQAKQGFEILEKVYGDKEAASIGLARVAIEEGRLDEARKTLDPLVKNALEDAEPDSIKGVRYGQAVLAYGILQEKEGKLPEALENYLRAIVVFDSDPATTALAESKANALRESNSELAVP